MSFSPRVVGEHSADFFNLQTLLASKPFKGKTGEALVLAIYDYFTSTVLGTYHWWPVDEAWGEPRRRRSVHDPLKLINCYGWMICGQCSAFLYNLYRAAGFQARQIGAPGHSLCEVFYDNRWHILDVDMWTWFRTPAGHIASPAELHANAKALIVENKNKSNPCNLPDRSLEGYAEMWATCEMEGDHVKTLCPPWNVLGHSMDFFLRPGEALTRSQLKRGCFPMPQLWHESMNRYTSEWKGEPRERYQPFRTYGNGRLTYAPKLDQHHRDFEFAAWERQGLTQDDQGLVGPGTVTIRLQSPYPFCAVPDVSQPRFAFRDGIELNLAGQGGCTVEIDRAEGGFQPVAAVDGDFKLRCDLSEAAQARYDCCLRLTLAAGAHLTAFQFDAALMTAPASLPRLVAGQNKMTLHLTDKYGLATIPWTELIDFRHIANPVQRAERVLNADVRPYVPGWRQIAPKNPGPVEAIYRFAAPPGRRFAWFYALASLREGPPAEPPRSGALQFSTDGVHWKTAGEIAIGNSHLQWDCAVNGEVKLPTPAETVFLRIASGTAITAVEFYGHLEAPAIPPQPLTITHRWVEGTPAEQMEFQIRLTPGGPVEPLDGTQYSLPCGDTPRDHELEMRVPSLAKT